MLRLFVFFFSLPPLTVCIDRLFRPFSYISMHAVIWGDDLFLFACTCPVAAMRRPPFCRGSFRNGLLLYIVRK